MAKTDNLSDFLTDVANAIRTKKGTVADIDAQDFYDEILSIPSGGSSEYGVDELSSPISATSGTSAVHYEGDTPAPASNTVTIPFTASLDNCDYLYFCYNGLDGGSGHTSGVHYGTSYAKLIINSTEYILYDYSSQQSYPSDHVEIVKKINVTSITGVPTIQLYLYASSSSSSPHYWANADVNVKHIYVHAIT
jgi:hypothetical protein